MKIAQLGFLTALVIPLPLAAVDIENGEELHFDDCTGCHQEEVYTRGQLMPGAAGYWMRYCYQ